MSSTRAGKTKKRRKKGSNSWLWEPFVRIGRGAISLVTKRREVLGILGVGVAMVTLSRLFLWPATDLPREVDAIVLFDELGDAPLDVALDLADRDLAPVLILSHGLDPVRPRANEVCRGRAGVEVLCPAPTPENATGDARLVGQAVAANDWTRVLVVTSTAQVSRARLLTERCTDATVLMVGVDPDAGWFTRVGQALYEAAAYGAARLGGATC